jgi:hypothetical protein
MGSFSFFIVAKKASLPAQGSFLLMREAEK